jgi:hypothetical protein
MSQERVEKQGILVGEKQGDLTSEGWLRGILAEHFGVN